MLVFIGLPLWLSWERICLQCERSGFDPWVGKILCRRERLPTQVFWPGEFHGLYVIWGRKESDVTEQLSLSLGFHCFCFSLVVLSRGCSLVAVHRLLIEVASLLAEHRL